MLISPPLENSRTATPTASSSNSPVIPVSQTHSTPSRMAPMLPTIPGSRASTVPNSPTRARSTGDLLSEHERSKNRDRPADNDKTGMRTIATLRNSSSLSLHDTGKSSEDANGGAIADSTQPFKEIKEKDVYVPICSCLTVF